MREALPNRRHSLNFLVEFAGERYSVTMGFYADGRLGEVFINRIFSANRTKLGEHLDAACRDAAIMMSFALQHGANIMDLKHSVTRDDDETTPMSIIGAVVDSFARQEVLDTRKPGIATAPASIVEEVLEEEAPIGALTNPSFIDPINEAILQRLECMLASLTKETEPA